MKKWKKLTAIVLCASLLAMIPAGCSKSKAESKFTVDKITMTYVKSPLNVPSMVDKSKGMFSEGFSAYGLPVAYSELTAGPDQTAALASGDIQFLFAVGDTSVILSASNGADIKIISIYSRSAKPFMLFSKDGSISSPADLKGKTIAGPKGTTLNALLVAYLKTGGMTLADVNFISMSFFRFLNPTVYWMQVICLLAGCVCLGLGISLEVQANVVILAGEGAVKAISQRFNTEFGVTKTFFDITLVAVSLVLSLVFLGRVSGLREGTAAAALCVGSISRFFIGRLCFLQDLFKGRPAENAGAEV